MDVDSESIDEAFDSDNSDVEEKTLELEISHLENKVDF